jgi:hypothetical protein
MPTVLLSKFKGIAPRYADNVRPGMASECVDVDLSNGQIAPRRADLAVGLVSSSGNWLTYFGGAWVSKEDAFFLQWKINEFDLLFYLENGILKRRIGSIVVDVGQSYPGAPVLSVGVPGDPAGTFSYFITTTREAGGYEDESGPSAVALITVTGSVIRVTRPTITDPYVTFWNIYRLGASANYLFLAQVPIGDLYYDDNISEATLSISGTAPTSWYTSLQGNDIMFAKPPTGLEGIATEIFSGMIFAWKGSSLYWSEPGVPDGWPSIYTMNFQTQIKNVIPFAGSVAVLCSGGPQRVDGTNPELLQPSIPLGKESCISKCAFGSNMGAIYLSDTGIVVFNLMETSIISGPFFGQEWFTENVNPDTAILALSHNVLYLFYGSQQVLYYDLINKNWGNFTADVHAVYIKPEDGDLYFLNRNSSIKKLIGNSSTLASCTWKSGKLLGNDPQADKLWSRLRATGTGLVSFSVLVDDIVIATKAINLDGLMERDLLFKFPENSKGKALKVQTSGAGTVREIMVEYESG